MTLANPVRSSSVPPHARVGGYVLTGGESSRMGRDKALLPIGGRPMGQHIASVVAAACGSATIVGDPARHGGWGFPVIPDLHAKVGPLGGIEAALAASQQPWVLVTACDMPALTIEFLRGLLDEAGDEVDAILPIPPGGPVNPLCGLYHQRVLGLVREAIERGDYKVTRALDRARLRLVPVDDGAPLRNANTPEEWQALIQRLESEGGLVT